MITEKLCPTCQEVKPIDQFGKRGGKSKRNNDWQVHCKPCDVEKTRLHRAESRRWVGEYKMEQGCQNCAFQAVHPCQLQLDHRDPTTKTRTGNGRAYEPSWRRERILEEIAKCDVLCANCHAFKTFTNKEHI